MENNSETANKQQPVLKVRAGNISATVWTNVHKKTVDGKEISYSIDSIQLEKSYKDGDDWKNTHQLNSNDLARAILVLNEVQRKLLLQQ